MNTLHHNLRLKRTPVLMHGSNAFAGGARVAARRTLTSGIAGSSPVASTMKHATAAVGVVVMPAHPCGEQQRYAWVWQNGNALVLHSSNGGSIPSTQTNRMRSAASESRQLLHAGGAHEDVRLSHKQMAVGANPIAGTKLRRRMVLVQLCQHGLKDGLSVSTGAYAGSSPAAGAKDQMRSRIQSSRIRLCASNSIGRVPCL